MPSRKTSTFGGTNDPPLMPCSKSLLYVADQQAKTALEKLCWPSLLSKCVSLLGKFPGFELDNDQH
jgi:hypothetical protein